MVETIGVLERDRFQVIAEHAPGELVYDPQYLGSLEQKRALYRRIAENLHEEAGVRAEDVLISLVEAGREDWSFGHGIAS